MLQLKQEADDVAPENKPYIPTAHGVQESEDEIECFPASHKTQNDAPSAEYEPASQGRHIVDDEGEYCPASHRAQEAEDETECFPASHNAQIEDPAAEYAPASQGRHSADDEGE